MSECPIHHLPFKIVPAGVSKKTGRPYPAFGVCPVIDCKERPSATETVQAEKPREDHYDRMWEGHVKGLNNLAGHMLSGAASPDLVLKALPTLLEIVKEIDKIAPRHDELPF